MKKNDITFDFSKKSVIVFGGSRGIGEEICRQFINSNATVYCASRTHCNIEGVTSIKCDISKPGDIYRLFNKFDNIDFVINVAGTNLCKTIDNIDLSEWNRLMDINLRSFFIISKQAVDIMKESGGRIINVSSIAGRHKSIVSGVHYTSSKYGIIGLTKQLAHEVSRYNILVNCVCPSQTMTKMLEESMSNKDIENLSKNIPIQRIASTEEQAMPVLFLCSSAASYITGATIDVNGGQF